MSIICLILGVTNVYCNNRGVAKNTNVTESTLNKKHNSINYHVVHKIVASGILRVGKKDTATNLADLITELVPYYHNQELLGQILWDY